MTIALLFAAVFAVWPGSTRLQAQAENGDFIQDGLKFHRTTPAGFTPTVYMATEISSSNPVGQIMVRPDGTRTVVGLGGYDKNKVELAYLKHATGSPDSGAASPAGAGPANSATAATVAPGFDAGSKTVTLSGQRSVTFVDDTHAEVKMPGAAGPLTYGLEYHKGGTGGFMKSLAATHQGRQGASFSGSGVAISAAGPNGTPGVFFDTAQGAILPGEVVRVKPIISAVREAVDAVQANGHPELAQETVIKSLLANNLGLK